MLAEDVVQFVQEFCNSRIFYPAVQPNGKKHDQWRQEWLELLGELSNESRSLTTLRAIQKEVQSYFGSSHVSVEEPIVNTFARTSSQAFDLFVPSDRTAIEVCLSAIKVEFEKDILKAMIDSRTTTLYIMARDYLTGVRGHSYGISYMAQPGPKSFIDLVRVYKLEVIPTQLCPKTTAN
jgi:hypothetical protein